MSRSIINNCIKVYKLCFIVNENYAYNKIKYISQKE